MAKDATGEYYYMISGGVDTKPTSKNPSKHVIKRSEKIPGYGRLRFCRRKSLR